MKTASQKKQTAEEVQANKEEIVNAFSRCEFCSGFEQKIDSAQEDPVSRQVAKDEKENLLQHMNELLQDERTNAEDIFEELKYRITAYVLKHEFNANHNLSVHLTLWLEKCQSPQSFEVLQKVMQTYLKPTDDSIGE